MRERTREVGQIEVVRGLRRADRAGRLPHAGRTLTIWGLWLIFAANLAVIVWLWLRGGGVSAVHAPDELITSIGRITGLVAAYLLLIQVLLLARLPWVERATGFDRLTVWHRRNGKLAIILVVAHVIFITIGYAMMDRLSIVREAQVLLVQYTGMIAATVGTALMVLVVISSLVIVRRRLRYESWYFVHLTAYAAIYLGWIHQIPTGNEFVANASQAAYWTALYLVTLALLLLFRIMQPIFRGFWHQMRVDEVIAEGPGVTSLRITGRNLSSLRARPGQFFLWRFLTPGRFWEAHPFSLSEAPNGRSLRITVKDSGDFTHRIGELKPGTRVAVEGPFGVFTDDVRTRERVLLIAGGIGITPIRAMLEQMEGDIVLIYRVVCEEDIVFQAELDGLVRERGITVHYVCAHHLDPGADRLLTPEHLRELVPDIGEREVFVCGPPVMMDLAERHVRAAGVPRAHVHAERFAF